MVKLKIARGAALNTFALLTGVLHREHTGIVGCLYKLERSSALPPDVRKAFGFPGRASFYFLARRGEAEPRLCEQSLR